MTVIFLVADCTSASSRLRILQYLPLLRQDRIQFRVCSTRPSKYLTRPYWLPSHRVCRLAYGVIGAALIILQRTWQIVVHVSRCHVVVLQKDLLYRSRLRFLERAVLSIARMRRARVVFDLDDAIYLGTSKEVVPHMWPKVLYVAGSASIVLAGSRVIGDELRPYSKAIAVLPTCIALSDRPDRSYARAPNELRLVWMGTATNARYLDLVADAIRHVTRGCRVRIEIVTRLGDLAPGLLAGLEVRWTEWSEAIEAAALGRADIALAPLPDNRWTRAKCGGRLLGYFAAAVPVVASPVGAQAEMVRHDVTGLIASSTSEWSACLAALRDSEDLRRRLGGAGRRLVEDHLCSHARYPLWRHLVLGTDARR